MPHSHRELTAPSLFSALAENEADEETTDWTEEEVVLLHWRLLQELRGLADPATPLEDKLDTLRWVFTEPEKDKRPFSFALCVRVVACSPLSPIAFCGLTDVSEIRTHVDRQATRWLRATVARYPAWVRDEICRNPAWVEEQLARDPRWLDEQIRDRTREPDLFA